MHVHIILLLYRNPIYICIPSIREPTSQYNIYINYYKHVKHYRTIMYSLYKTPDVTRYAVCVHSSHRPRSAAPVLTAPLRGRRPSPPHYGGGAGSNSQNCPISATPY